MRRLTLFDQMVIGILLSKRHSMNFNIIDLHILHMDGNFRVTEN